ncbi:glycosyltransferase family 39 protein [Gimesia algae]|uniref:Glycosyltransferase RgtA/B/C/D-like domain-containing protein n=1 Tax=Gimesia algae TaxID=2527971 RepID=A0A517VLG8_9PLAN|nr:glycosyltransferase family 39 protein [Gimesia algae]QDT93862.1 hypothetical protein Pan161_55490 [Gimesia algae]
MSVTKPGFLTTTLLLVLFLASGLRLTMVVLQSDQLQEDRDAYIAIARNLAAGHGFTSSRVAEGPDVEPTAFRPPLYPCLLAALYYVKAGALGVGLMQVLLGALTVWFTWKTGLRLRMRVGALVAAAIVATDPVLLQYTSYAMTEVLSAFLTSLLLYMLVCQLTEEPGQPEPQNKASKTFVTGLVWGLAILCRPTYLAFFGLWFLARLCGPVLKRVLKTQPAGFANRHLTYLSAGILIAVSPWLIRNLMVFHAPILTTTHGGYTLLLGNNPVFYQEVVLQPWGTVWSGESLDAWQKSLERDLENTVPPIKSEQERDRWMYQRAKANIAAEPSLFVQSCLLRLRRFWNFSPLNSHLVESKPLIGWGIAGYYLLILTGTLGGCLLLIWKREPAWGSLFWLIVSFTVVHIFYWTNMRMRAPLVPAIALLSVYGWSKSADFLKFRKPTETREHDIRNTL